MLVWFAGYEFTYLVLLCFVVVLGYSWLLFALVSVDVVGA